MHSELVIGEAPTMVPAALEGVLVTAGTASYLALGADTSSAATCTPAAHNTLSSVSPIHIINNCVP